MTTQEKIAEALVSRLNRAADLAEEQETTFQGVRDRVHTAQAEAEAVYAKLMEGDATEDDIRRAAELTVFYSSLVHAFDLSIAAMNAVITLAADRAEGNA